MARPTHLASSLGLALSSSLWACSTDPPRGAAAGPPEGAGGTSGHTSTSGSGVAGNLGLGGGGAGGPCALACSADLKSIVDCNGALVEKCAGGKACASGTCIDDACDAARQSKSSYGCDYWTLNAESDLKGACYAAFVANIWSTPVHIQVERAGATFPTSQFARIPSGQGAGLAYGAYDDAVGLPPGQVAILFLAGDPASAPACPPGVSPAVPEATSKWSPATGDAFHIATDEPVVAYQIYPYGGAAAAISSATLLLPTSAWDVNYIAVDGYHPGYPNLDLLAAEDGTEVTINPVAPIEAGDGVQGTAAGVPVTYTLQRGQFVQLTTEYNAQTGDVPEIAGSAVLANKPIGMFGGTRGLIIPPGSCCFDGSHQQIPPVKALGREYVAVRYRGRQGQDEIVPWRLVGAVDGTALTWSPGPPPGAPATLSSGQVVELAAPGPFVVRSQDADHPFYAAAYMTAGISFGGEGDPEWVNVVPAGQYLDAYVFFTDPTYSETELVVVRKRGKDGQFADVELDCLGVLGGWEPVGDFEYTRVNLVEGFADVGACSNGRREMSSKVPFGVTVWGWGNYVSYAYPAGMSVRPVNTVVVPPVPK